MQLLELIYLYIFLLILLRVSQILVVLGLYLLTSVSHNPWNPKFMLPGLANVLKAKLTSQLHLSLRLFLFTQFLTFGDLSLFFSSFMYSKAF